MIATKIAKIEATMIFKLRILLYLKAIGKLQREYEKGFRARCNVAIGVKDNWSRCTFPRSIAAFRRQKGFTTGWSSATVQEE